jgi:hypothetical protein
MPRPAALRRSTRLVLPLLALCSLGALATGAAACSGNGGESVVPLNEDDAAADASQDDASQDDTSQGETSLPPSEAGADAKPDVVVDQGADLGVDGLPVGCQIRATSDVNLRSGPGTSYAILHVIPNGDLATVLTSAPQGGFYNLRHGGADGWASGTYFDKTCVTTTDASTPDTSPTDGATLASIESIALGSSCYTYSWKDRGQAPRGYIKGVADVFARAVCNQTRSDVVLVSKAKTTDAEHDALAWYSTEFANLGMSNDVAGLDTLRHVYTLLIGLGMRESSGEHCCGRDTSATNTTADSAEAGAWQTSYDSHTLSTELPKLFTAYKASSAGCYRSTFADGVTCSAANWQDWGTGDGYDFQKLEKECPGFAAFYAAVILRVSGGSVGHYGPLRTKAAEVRPECDAMLKQVQTLVTNNPGLCASL